mgnify:CR=1 FL=1
MNKKILTLAALAAVTLAGAAAWLAFAQDDPIAPIQRTLTVSGSGTVGAVPDVLEATVGVETSNAQLGEALAENNARIQAVLDRLAELGVAETDVRTVDFYISESRNRDGEITGFRVVNNVRVTLRDLAAAGGVLDAVIQVGANRVSSVQLALSDAAALLSQARQQAVADARAKAREIAEAAGMFLGSAITIHDGGGFAPIAEARAAVAEFDAGVPIASGSLSVSAHVTITYEMF